MEVQFHKEPALVNHEIQVVVKAPEESQTVRELINYLNQFKMSPRRLLPIKTTDRIVTIKCQDLIKVEVQATTLSYYTVNEVVKTSGRLYQTLDALDNNFIQVSRHSVINLNYLESIESGFAGNMIAILDHKLKADVSRRYLPQLEKELGL